MHHDSGIGKLENEVARKVHDSRFTIHNYASLLSFVLVARGSRAGHQGPWSFQVGPFPEIAALAPEMAISDSHL